MFWFFLLCNNAKSWWCVCYLLLLKNLYSRRDRLEHLNCCVEIEGFSSFPVLMSDEYALTGPVVLCTSSSYIHCTYCMVYKYLLDLMSTLVGVGGTETPLKLAMTLKRLFNHERVVQYIRSTSMNSNQQHRGGIQSHQRATDDSANHWRFYRADKSDKPREGANSRDGRVSLERSPHLISPGAN
jgi:hypothetical protein